MIIRLQRDTNRTLSLSFHYLPALHLVTVQGTEFPDAALLAGVSVADAGGSRAEPGEATSASGAAVEATRPDRPYRFWLSQNYHDVMDAAQAWQIASHSAQFVVLWTQRTCSHGCHHP